MAIGKVNVSSGNNGKGEVLIEFNNYVSDNNTGGDNPKMILELPIGTKYKFTEHDDEQVATEQSILVNSPATGYVKLNDGILNTSTFGRIWKPVEIDGNGNIISYIWYVNKMWIAEVSDGEDNTGLWYSTDGINWNHSNINDQYFNGCVYENNIWILGGNNGIYHSTDGINWIQNIEILDSSMKTIYINSMWFAISYNNKGVYYSIDGINWSKNNLPLTALSENIIYKDEIWVTTSMYDGMWYSTDGITWAQSNITNSGFYNVIYANNMWFACGIDGIYYSNDGMIWTQSDMHMGSTAITYNNIWLAECGGNDEFGIYYSTNGINWIKSSLMYSYVNSCIHKDGIWVIGDGDGIYHSTDGINWIQSIEILDSMMVCFFYNNMYIACSQEDSGIYYSVDAINWTPSNITSGVAGILQYGDNRILAGGSYNIMTV